MKLLALAIAITAEAFKNTFDKGGHPYILHCLYVMDNTSGDEDVKCAAVMHDLIEDTSYTPGDLIALGFSERTVNLIRLLTHDPKMGEYMDYIKGISMDPDATKIKLADLEHNSHITRIKGLRKKDLDRIEKYHRAYIYLKN